MKRMAAVSLTLCLFSACSSKSEFNGAPSKGEPAPHDAEETPEPTPPAASTSVSPVCTDKAALTDAKLLSGAIKNNTLNQHLQYEVSLKDCEGKNIDISGRSIQFDIDASLSNYGLDLNYSIKPSPDNGSDVLTGALTSVKGSDLFGNTGEFAYWTTDSVTFTSPGDKVILDIDMSMTTATPHGTPSDAKQTADYDIKTILRFGEASPVAQTVKFTP